MMDFGYLGRKADEMELAVDKIVERSKSMVDFDMVATMAPDELVLLQESFEAIKPMLDYYKQLEQNQKDILRALEMIWNKLEEMEKKGE